MAWASAWVPKVFSCREMSTSCSEWGRGTGRKRTDSTRASWGVANVLAEPLEPEAAEGLAGLFDGERDVAELAVGGLPGVGGGHAAVDVVSGLVFDVGLELFEELISAFLPAKHGLPPVMSSLPRWVPGSAR